MSTGRQYSSNFHANVWDGGGAPRRQRGGHQCAESSQTVAHGQGDLVRNDSQGDSCGRAGARSAAMSGACAAGQAGSLTRGGYGDPPRWWAAAAGVVVRRAHRPWRYAVVPAGHGHVGRVRRVGKGRRRGSRGQRQARGQTEMDIGTPPAILVHTYRMRPTHKTPTRPQNIELLGLAATPTHGHPYTPHTPSHPRAQDTHARTPTTQSRRKKKKASTEIETMV